MTFDVLGTMRAIRNDEGLTSTQLALLMCAVLRTDNATGHVRYSIELLAQDANVSYRTAKTVFQDEEVLRYFKKVVRTRRTVDFWFPLSPEGATVALSGGNPVHRGGNGCTPSTSSSTRPTSTTTVADAPVEKEDVEVREGGQPSPNYKDEPPDLPNVGSRDAAQAAEIVRTSRGWRVGPVTYMSEFDAEAARQRLKEKEKVS